MLVVYGILKFERVRTSEEAIGQHKHTSFPSKVDVPNSVRLHTLIGHL